MLYRMIHQPCLTPFFPLKINVFKFLFLKYLSRHTQRQNLQTFKCIVLVVQTIPEDIYFLKMLIGTPNSKIRTSSCSVIEIFVPSKDNNISSP